MNVTDQEYRALTQDDGQNSNSSPVIIEASEKVEPDKKWKWNQMLNFIYNCVNHSSELFIWKTKQPKTKCKKATKILTQKGFVRF